MKNIIMMMIILIIPPLLLTIVLPVEGAWYSAMVFVIICVISVIGSILIASFAKLNKSSYFHLMGILVSVWDFTLVPMEDKMNKSKCVTKWSLALSRSAIGLGYNIFAVFFFLLDLIILNTLVFLMKKITKKPHEVP